MASPIATSLNATTRTKFVKGPIVDAISNRNPLIAAVKKNGNIKMNQGGLTIRPPGIAYKDPTIYEWDGRNQTIVQELDLYNYAEHQWNGLFTTKIDNKFDDLVNKGEEQLADKSEEDLKRLKQAWMNKFETILYVDGTAATPLALAGLESFMKITGTYGTLSQAAQDANSLYWWAPTILNGATGITGITFKQDPRAYLKNFSNSIGNRRAGGGLTVEDGPDLGLTTQVIHEHITRFYEGLTKQTLTVSSDTVGMNTRMLKAEGMDIYWATRCTASTLYGLVTDELNLYFQTAEMIETHDIDIYAPIGKIHQEYSKLAMWTNNPRAFGKITNISV